MPHVAGLTEIYRGHRHLLAVDSAAAVGDLALGLQALGSGDILVVAPATGIGRLEVDVDVELVDVPVAPTPTEAIRNTARVFLDPPAALRGKLDRFDPEGSARVLTAPFMPSPVLLGRRVYGGRRAEWERLEDKIAVLDVWAEAKVTVAPSRVVPVADAPSAAAEVASDMGTVWTADNSTGWHGGGSHTRWVNGSSSARSAMGFFESRARLVRVMPFLDGTPCSIHGVVTDRGVAVGRPVELLMLRVPEPPGFFYAQVSTTWDPTEDRRAEMREAARRVGRLLGERWGYRGAFGIDGVSTVDGFLPNEINTRLSAGLHVYAGTIPGLHLGLLDRALIEREVDVDPEWLESVIVAHGDRTRVAGCGIPVPVVIPPESVSVRIVPGAVEESPDGARHGVVEAAPSVNGSYLRFRLDAPHVEEGRSMAPLAAQVARFASQRWNLGLPELHPAPDIR